MSKKIKVLIIDDSAMVRQILAKGLSEDAGIEVVDTASDPYVARDKIIKYDPDVLTLDVEMPRMDGLEFLKKLMPQHPLPVIMVSSLTQKGKRITFDALEAGAVDFISKPTANIQDGLNSMLMELRTKIKIASTANVSAWKEHRTDRPIVKKITDNALAETTNKVIAIGASTGGTEAIKDVIEYLPPSTPGVVIVQHMPPGFTKMYADRLNQIAQMRVIEGTDGELVVPGKVIIAPGDKHMIVERKGGEYIIKCFDGEKVSGHCPSVDVLFESVAKNVGSNAIGVILTGMGGDGANGMFNMKEKGSYNICQNEKTCIVYGMPKVAKDKGAVHEELPLQEIGTRLIEKIKGR